MKKKIMLHLIMPNQVSGPNTAARLIFNSKFKNKYNIDYLKQDFHAGGRVNTKLLTQLKNQIIKFKPNLIHLSGLQSSGFHAALAARLAGVKNILIAIRGSSTVSNEIGSFKKLLFGRFFEPLTLHLARNYYTVTNFQQKSFLSNSQSRSKKNLGCIHNSVDVEKCSPKTFRKTDKTKEKLIVSYIGRVTYDKGLYFLMEAIKRVKCENVEFLIIGDGSFLIDAKKSLKNLIDVNKVKFMGRVKDPSEYYLYSDIFILPSLHENLSNALLQACASGACVIATNVGGNPEVIKDHYNGLLVDPKSIEQLVSAIEQLAKNKLMRQNLVKNSFKEITKFDMKKMEAKLDVIYSKMLRNK